MASAPADLPPLLKDDASRSRPPELEDGLNRFVYHPLAHRLARLLKPTGISADAVSVAGMLLVWAAAYAYTGLDRPQSFLIGFSLHLLWHIFDGADGDLARLNGRTSPTGELVDGVCDYAGHVPLYVALAAMLDNSIGGWAWALATAAGASHIAQTNHAESQRRFYLWWVYGVPWLKHAQTAGDEVFRGDKWFSRTFGWMARDYLKLVNLMTPHAARIDAEVEESRGDPRRTALIRRLAQHASRRSLALQKLLGPNPRTIILGASMALGSPLYFFLAEAVLLNLILVASVRHHNAVGRGLVEKLGRGGG
jgi:CDP-alcohol phosphatidyltransferase